MKTISNNFRIIAEVANAHQGKAEIAEKIVKAVSQTGANVIKFQIFTANELLEKKHEKFKLFQNLEFTNKEWSHLFKLAKKNKLKIFADVFGLSSAKFALSQKLDGFKIHSSDVTNPVMLNFFSKLKTPVLLSTAGCYPNEIDEAIKILSKEKKEIILMHGFQGYPTKIHDLNLSRLLNLKKQFGLPIGLMDHISGNSEMSKIIPLLGLGLGINVIEKHITLNRQKKNIDYFSSLNPDEFNEFVNLVHKSKIALGAKDFSLSKNEITYRLEHKKNPLAKKDISKSSNLRPNLFDYKRTKKKIDSVSYFDFIGKFNSKKINKGDTITRKLLSNNKKVVAVIACRAESDRLYGKPLQLIGGFPILHLLIKQLKTSKKIDDIVLAVSEKPGNEIFLDFASKHKLKAIIGDDEDVLQRLIDGAKYVNADIIFRVTSENPYIFWECIDQVILDHIKGKYDFSFVKEIPIGSGFEVINLDAFIKSHKSGNKKHRSELCSLYIREHKKSFKIKSYIPPKELRKPHMRLTVDTPEDLLVARIIHDSLGKKDNPINLLKIIKLINQNTNIAKINSNIPLGVTRIWP